MRCRAATRFVHRLRPTSRARIADEALPVSAVAADAWCAEIPVIGALDSIVLRPTERRALGPHEVEVAVEAASLNFRDVVVATGVVQGLEASDTFGGRRLGIDCAGTVTRCGANVTHVKPGDAVLGIAQGTFASYVVTDAALVVRRPPRLSAAEASTIPVAFVTVWYALRRLAQLRAGEAVLVHAASGGVGLAAIQIAQSIGARIFATAGSPAKRQFVEALGVESVMDSRTHDFADEVRQRTGGRGVDVVLNSLPGEAIARGFSALAPYGRFVELGKADIYQNHRLDLGPFRKNLSLFAVDLDRMCFERPADIGEMLQEVVDAFSAGVLRPPPCTEFDMNHLADAMRFMAQAKHIGKVVVNVGTTVGLRAPVPEHPPIRPDATYLITGGLGGLGLVVGHWLVEHGARSLVLAGRSAPSADAAAKVAELGRSGARVDVVSVDVSNAIDVRRLVEQIKRNLPPLRGIVHAAMVLDDRGLADLDADSMARVMAPKVLGAWHLHEATLEDDLEFFVSYSSITSLLGNPLQANYAAANAFLDAFATWRRGQGRPATTVNWGVIAGAGYVARHREVESYLNRQGYMSFTPEETLEVLSELLRHDAASVMAARIDWARFGDVGGRASLSPQIRHLVPAAADEAAPLAGGSLRAMLADASPATRIERVEEYLRRQIAELLGASAAALDVERPIIDLGLDSLIAVELTLALERDLGVEIAGATLLGGLTIRKLASDVLGRMQLSARRRSQRLSRQVLPSPATAKTSEGVHQRPRQPRAKRHRVCRCWRGRRRHCALLLRIISARADELEGRERERLEGRTGGSGGGGRRLSRPRDSRWSASQQIIRSRCSRRGSMRRRGRTRAVSSIFPPRRRAHRRRLTSEYGRRAADVYASSAPRDHLAGPWSSSSSESWTGSASDMGRRFDISRGQAGRRSVAAAARARSSMPAARARAGAGGDAQPNGLLRGQTGRRNLVDTCDVPVVPVVAGGQERWRTQWKHMRRLPIAVRARRAGSIFRLGAGVARRTFAITPISVMARMAELLRPVSRRLRIFRGRCGNKCGWRARDVAREV